jgi:hypothetical protein
MNIKKVVVGLLIFIIIGVFVAGFGVVLKLYLDSQKQLGIIKTQMALGVTPTKPDESEVVVKVGKHILLPSDEPKIITLENVESLKKEQPFFEKAVDGDKVLVYSQKVILYNPTLDKIIEIAQIKAENPNNIAIPSPATSSATQL